ncbi:MAG: oligosaccharide flippase family protein [Anaerolineae bacterium]
MRDKGLRQDLAVILILLVLPILFFWPVTLGGNSLLPIDNAFAWEPWHSAAEQLGVGVPHNALLSDLYIQNYAWKRLIVSSIEARQIPLWNPYLFAGVPFLAAGQHSAMYPPSALFYLLPLTAAYGWFAALHLFLAGLFTYLFARTLRLGRPGSAIAALTFMFCGFMVVSNVHPMIVAAAVWLPLILALIERIVRRAEQGGLRPVAYLPDLALGALAFGMVLLAGHPEMYYYVALISAAYALYRLFSLRHSRRRALAVAGGLFGMAALGVGIGAAQWMPLLDLVRYNFRQGGAALSQVLEWAYPMRHLLTLFLPDFYGNPAHHSYLDLYSGQRTPVTVNALGESIHNVFWGMKNYVEGALYVGTLPLVLATLALWRSRIRQRAFFAVLAVIALLFAFGSPLYWLVYQLPGFSQVHTPFRWVYAFSLSTALLAGMGVDALLRRGSDAPQTSRLGRLLDRIATPALTWGTLLAGLGILAGLALSLAVKEQVAALAERALQRLALAPQAFVDGRMFFSYEFRNLFILGTTLLLGGALLAARRRFRHDAVWSALVGAVIVGELFAIGLPFFPRTDASLVAYRPPVVDFLQEDTGLYRVTSYGDSKTLHANAGMFYGIQDVRGYDSIIPRQYVDYMALIAPQGMLEYNQIGSLPGSQPETLDSPLLDALNVKYVLTERTRSIDRAGYTLVYDGEIRVYRNEDVLPRAYLVQEALVLADDEERRQALLTFDPRRTVILEEPPALEPSTAAVDLSTSVVDVAYTPNEVTITVEAPVPALLVLADSYMDGWQAFVRPADAENPADAEQRLTIYRANGNFRAVEVPAGTSVVRFKYSPPVVKYGLYTSFMAVVILGLAGLAWAWLRFYRESTEDAAAQRVTKNTVAPIALSLLNKGIDMAFAMLMLRVLGPVDAGEYYWAVVVISWFDILTNFGLNTLVTREVAVDRSQANRYLCNSIILRMGLCLAAFPILGLLFLIVGISSPVNPTTMLAVGLFAIALIPSNISASYSAIFMAYERMEIPASISTVTTVAKVVLGSVALAVGGSYVGLAVVSVVVNLLTVSVFVHLLRTRLFRPHLEVDFRFQKEMLRPSYPLMINNLLATLFFKVAVMLIKEIVPDPRALGWYNTAYKYVDAVGVIPAYFTIAIFPLMSRYAATARGSLLKAYRLAIKLLLLTAIPTATLISALSTELITILGGSQYLPQGADILRVMIWYMPFGFINSVTQYVLIALDQQRFLTRAFAIGLTFSVAANVFFLNRFGYMASAYIAIASEIVLLIPFYVGVRRALAPLPWAALVWKQAVSALPMAALVSLLPHRYAPLTVPLGLALYALGLILLRVFDQEEQEIAHRVVPLHRLKARLARLLPSSVD